MERIAQSAAAKLRKNRTSPTEKDLWFLDKYPDCEGHCQVYPERGISNTDSARHRLLECCQTQNGLKQLQDRIDSLLQEEGINPTINPFAAIEDFPEAQISLLAGFCPINSPPKSKKHSN